MLRSTRRRRRRESSGMEMSEILKKGQAMRGIFQAANDGRRD